MDSGLGTPLKCSKQIPVNTGFEENSAQNVSEWNNLTFPNTSVLLSETAKLDCGENMPDDATLILDNWLIFSKICILVWIIGEKTGDNPHWKSDSIDNKCVTK